MTREEAVKEIKNMAKFNYTLAPTEVFDMAIKALEQEPFEDAVSRNQAQNRIKEICNEYALTYYDSDTPYRGSSSYALGHAFDNLPSVTPTQRWIPVSERLPENNGKYLVTMKGIFNYFYISTTSYAKDLHKVDKYDFKSGIGDGWYNYDGEYGHYKIDNVVAWMPLPEPYKAEMESEE